MRFQLFLMGAAAVVAASANAADLSGVSGTVTGGYNYSELNGIADNAFDFGGAVNYAIPGVKLNVQGFADYAENKAERVAADSWTSGGAVSWRDADFAAGFNGSYASTRLLGSSLSYGTYGVFSEYYGLDKLGFNPITLRLNGGGISGSFANVHGDGGYYGGGASYYVLPQLALNLDASYNTVSSLRWSTFEAGVKYLPVETLPVTISTAYQHENTGIFGGSTHSDGFMIRLAYHFDDGAKTLADIDRNGPLELRSPAAPLDVLTSAARLR